jgi:hypothetical protein
MILLLFAAAAAIPSPEEFRVTAIGRSWTECITAYSSDIETDSTTLSDEAKFELANSVCAAFRNDYRSAALQYAPIYLRRDGVKSVGPDVSNLLAEKMLDLFERNIKAGVLDEMKRKKDR